MSEAPIATLAICTRERPRELARLLESIGESRFSGERPFVDVLVVVNGELDDSQHDPTSLAELCGFPVRVISEPRIGVTYARNASIANRHPHAKWFISVDDDEFVTPSWLNSHLQFVDAHQPDVVSGPVLTIIGTEARPWVRELWASTPRHPTGSKHRRFLGGNVVFRSSLFDELDSWYDNRDALSTGDDAALGYKLETHGYKVIWNDNAIAWEPVHPRRLTTGWLAKRFLSYGAADAQRARREGGWQSIADATRKQHRYLRCLASSVLRSRNAYYFGEAFASFFRLAGFAGGLVGYRVRDYRRIS